MITKLIFTFCAIYNLILLLVFIDMIVNPDSKEVFKQIAGLTQKQVVRDLFIGIILIIILCVMLF